MKKVREEDISAPPPENTEGVRFRPLIADNVGAPSFYLRVFEIEPGGHTPFHKHEWEHGIYVVSGKGRIVLEGDEEDLAPGNALLVEPYDMHQFVNDGSEVLKLICVIPKPKGI